MFDITYFIAAVYGRLEEKRPGGTPYLNLCLSMAIIFVIHVIQLLLTLKVFFHRNLIPRPNGVFLLLIFFIGWIFWTLFSVVFPQERLRDMEVENKYAKTAYGITVAYAVINYLIMMCLILLSAH